MEYILKLMGQKEKFSERLAQLLQSPKKKKRAKRFLINDEDKVEGKKRKEK